MSMADIQRRKNANKANPQQRLFVEEFLRLRRKNQTQAAKNAGYAANSAQQQGTQLMRNPRVAEYLAIREEELEQGLRDDFFFDALKAREVLFDVMNDPKAHNRDKITAAKDFLDRAGYKAMDRSQVEISGEVETKNPLEGMTTEELRKMMNNDKTK